MVLLDYEKLTEESNDIKLVNLDYIGAKDVALFRQWVVPHLLPVEPPIANSLYQEVLNRMPDDERERMLFLGKTLPRLVKQLIEAK